MSSNDGSVRVGDLTIGGGRPFALIAGPCVIESRESVLRHAETIREVARRVGVPLVFKCSFDKANRTSIGSYRGLGMERGLEILSETRRQLGVPVPLQPDVPGLIRHMPPAGPAHRSKGRPPRILHGR